MELSFGTLELNRSNQAHLGTKQIQPLSYTISSDGKIHPVDMVSRDTQASDIQRTSKSGQKSFESYLVDAVTELNNQQMKVDNLQKQVITDPDSVDIHDVTTAMAKAKMSLELAHTVINRLVEGWNEISQNR